MSSEAVSRCAFGLVVVALPAALLVAWRFGESGSTTVRARLPEAGGWLPATLHATSGEAIRLRLISDDVVHGFAIGRSDRPSIELKPGEVVEASLTFDQPGTYTYYCTRWCGPDHWRMRGVIEVEGAGTPLPPPEPALYVALGIDLDAPHETSTTPQVRPSAGRGAALGVALPDGNATRQDFIARPPAEIWESLRTDPTTSALTDSEVWDLVAHLWSSTTTPTALEEGRTLYAANCAACHGEDGKGEGVMADRLSEAQAPAMPSATSVHAGGHHSAPADFTNPAIMLGASSALLQGKIARGGMGTGMPYWGPIFTEAQTWALADYLWAFQFEEGE